MMMTSDVLIKKLYNGYPSSAVYIILYKLRNGSLASHVKRFTCEGLVRGMELRRCV